MAKLTRRELARLAGAMASCACRGAGRASPEAPAAYIGPLTGVTDWPSTIADSIRWPTRAICTRRRRGGFDSRRARAARPRRGRRRSAIEADRARRRLPGRARSRFGRSRSRRARFPATRARRSSSTAGPASACSRIVLLPEKARRPAPVMICVPGHGRGVDDIVGIDEQGGDRTDKAGYQHDFAIQVAEAGMAAVAIEPMGFGCRRDPINARQGLSRKACEPVGGRRAAGRPDDDRLARVGRHAHDRLHRDAPGARLEPRRLHGHLGRRHRDPVRDGARAAHPRRDGERLPEHVPRQRRQPRALHRQLRAGHPELGRDARHRRPDRAAAAVRRVGREGQHLPDSRRASRASTRCARSTASSARRIASSRRSFPASTRSGASAASRSSRVT